MEETKQVIPEKKEAVEVAKKYEEGVVVKGSGEAVYVIGKEGERRVIPNMFTYVQMGISADHIVHLKEKELEAIPEGDPMPQLRPRRRKPAR